MKKVVSSLLALLMVISVLPLHMVQASEEKDYVYDWSMVGNNLPGEVKYVASASENDHILAIANNAVNSIAKDGTTWSQDFTLSDPKKIKRVNEQTNQYVVLQKSDIYKVTFNVNKYMKGTSFKSGGTAPSSDFESFVQVGEDNYFLATKSNGVFYFNGATWQSVSGPKSGSTLLQLKEIFTISNKVYVGATNTGLFEFNGDLATPEWTQVGNTLASNNIHDLVTWNGSFYIGSNNTGVRKLNEEGTSWLSTTITQHIRNLFIYDNRLYVVTQQNGIYVSLDGETFKQIKSKSSSQLPNGQIEDSVVVGNELIVGNKAKQVYKIDLSSHEEQSAGDVGNVVGPPTTANSNITMPQGTLSVGQPFEFTVTLRDSSNRLVTESALSLTLNKGQLLNVVESTDNPGTYSLTATYDKAEKTTIKVRFNGIDILELKDVTFAAVLVPGVPVAMNSTITNPVGSLEVNQPFTFSIVLRDFENTVVTGATIGVSSLSLNKGTLVDVVESSQNPGTYTLTATYDKAEKTTIKVRFNSTDILELKDLTFVAALVAGVPVSANSTITYPVGDVEVNKPYIFTIVLRDFANNPVTGAAIGASSLSLNNGTLVNVVESTQNPGTYTLTATYDKIEKKTIKIRFSGTDILELKDLQFVMAQGPGIPSLSKSSTDVQGDLIVNSTFNIILYLRDINDDPVSGVAESLKLNKGQSITVVEGANGTYMFSLRYDKAETTNIKIQYMNSDFIEIKNLTFLANLQPFDPSSIPSLGSLAADAGIAGSHSAGSQYDSNTSFSLIQDVSGLLAQSPSTPTPGSGSSSSGSSGSGSTSGGGSSSTTQPTNNTQATTINNIAQQAATANTAQARTELAQNTAQTLQAMATSTTTIANAAQATSVAQEKSDALKTTALVVSKLDKAEDIAKVLDGTKNVLNSSKDAISKVEPQQAVSIAKDIIENAVAVKNAVNGSRSQVAKELQEVQKAIQDTAQTAIQRAGVTMVSSEGLQKQGDQVTAKVTVDTILTSANQVSQATQEINATLNKEQIIVNKSFETSVRIAIPKEDGTNVATAVIPFTAMQEVANKNIQGIGIQIQTANITIQTGIFNGTRGADITISAGRIESSQLSAVARQNVPSSSNVVELKIALDGQNIRQFQKPVKVEIPYTLKAGENPKTITAFYLKDDGSIEAVGGNYNEATGNVEFVTNHFSKFFAMPASRSFVDTSSITWANDAVSTLAGKGIIRGVGLNAEKSGELFNPNANVTRAEFASMIVRMLKLDGSQTTTPFADVKESAWYADAIRAAYANGIINGKSATAFDPEGKITRQEMAVMIARVLEQQGYRATTSQEHNFPDSSVIATWAQAGVALVSREEIVTGMGDGSFAPTANATRAQTAVMLYRLLGK
ncbi:hypothetical protein BHU72_06950 [Desulfuribacillus stibiiarsenatis]|uniref:SLH domain-containing protein n=2 Tax=Desulfuribacillus stibiiarsenatis TaxID=1390249 RepID=A0A1E5L4D9_9FIRM|nr:hypothetical protein BHU72_06950 [Desulfuribacillus stibiiarsenatis]